MQTSTGYESETKIFPFGEGTIRIENLTPILPAKEREQCKLEAQQRLFDVLSKYQ